MNKKLYHKLLQEKLAVLNAYQPPDILEECLPYQVDFIKDPARRKVVCSTRRSGKSFTLVSYLVYEALKTPNGIFAFLTLTNASVLKIVKPILQHISDKFNLKLKIDSKYNIVFPNGAIIYLVGLDATPNQKERIRGVKFDLACIDECQGFTQDLREVIENVLDIALAQSKSTLVMAGTPGNQQGNHYFYQVNRKDSPETQWKKFFFDWRHNTSVDPKSGIPVCVSIQEELDEKIRLNPLIEALPSHRQEWLGEWVVETSARVYKSTPVNYITDLPNNFLHGAIYILSIDLGYNDATAFVISAYNKNYSKNMYVIESVKHSNLTITAVANLIKQYRLKYTFQSIIVDAANLQAVEEMRQIHSLPLVAAEKAGKEAHIALLNSDFITQNVFILKQSNEELIKELETLIWDTKALVLGKHKEDARKENHLADSLLYSHHASRHYWFHSPDPALPPDQANLKRIMDQYTKPPQAGLVKPFWERNRNYQRY